MKVVFGKEQRPRPPSTSRPSKISFIIAQATRSLVMVIGSRRPLLEKVHIIHSQVVKYVETFLFHELTPLHPLVARYMPLNGSSTCFNVS